MVIAAIIAGVIASLFQLWVGVVSPIQMATDVGDAAFKIMVPKLVYAFVIPIFVTVFGWFGITPRQMT